jgi:tetratricopeptide (TPR) repeat protein
MAQAAHIPAVSFPIAGFQIVLGRSAEVRQVAAFSLAVSETSVADCQAFIEAGAYTARGLWSKAGWAGRAAAQEKPLALRQAEVAAGKYAVVIGINHYLSPDITELSFCEDDALAVRDALITACGYPESHVTLLLGTQATFEAIRAAIKLLADPQAYPGADTVLFYFSGHGAQIGGKNMLVPVDGSADPELAVARNLPLDWVQEQLAKSAFARQVMLVDACRNVFETKGLSAEKGFINPQLAQEYAKGMKVLLGTRPGEFSREDAELGHGLFTYYVVQGLQGGAADAQSGLVTAGALEDYVFGRMAEYSRGHPGQEQIPYTLGEGSSAMPLAIVLRPANELVARLGLAGMQDKELGEVAVAILDERLNVRQRNELPEASWQAYEQVLRRKLVEGPAALGLYLLAGLDLELSKGKDDPRAAEALGLAQRCVAAAPGSAQAKCVLGLAYCNLKRYYEAIAEYQEAIRLDPQYATPHNSLGNVYRDLKRYDAAIAEYKEAIRLDPQSAYPHSSLGFVYWILDRYDEAIAEYVEAIRLDPQYARPHSGLGSVYYTQKRYDEAIAELKAAIRLDPQDAYTHNTLAHWYYERRDYSSAKEHFLRAKELSQPGEWEYDTAVEYLAKPELH